jgi:hypothetical protein
MNEPDRAIAALRKLLSMPYEGPFAKNNTPFTPALLRLDPMFDPLRNDPRGSKNSARKSSLNDTNYTNPHETRIARIVTNTLINWCELVKLVSAWIISANS